MIAPGDTAATPLANPLTVAGVVRRVVVPSPSWPAQLSPQHAAAPVEVVAQEWPHPPRIVASVMPGLNTGVGVVLALTVPSPSTPYGPIPST